MKTETAKHTPGPWIIDQSGAGLEIRPPRSIHVITIVPHGDKANARLIAAAPELLTMLEIFRSVHCHSKPFCGKCLAADEVIRKANGKSVGAPSQQQSGEDDKRSEADAAEPE